MKKDLINLIVARISKKELEKVHPDWIEKYKGFSFIKNEQKEDLKKVLLQKIIRYAKEQNYYIYNDFVVWETDNSFVVYVLAYPRFVPGTAKKLRPPKLTPEEFVEIFKKKLSEYEFYNLASIPDNEE